MQSVLLKSCSLFVPIINLASFDRNIQFSMRSCFWLKKNCLFASLPQQTRAGVLFLLAALKEGSDSILPGLDVLAAGTDADNGVFGLKPAKFAPAISRFHLPSDKETSAARLQSGLTRCLA